MKNFALIILCIFALSSSITSAQSQNSNDNYMSRYEKYINENIDTSAYFRHNLCYIDDDSIPEFCLMGHCYAEGTIILSQHNGKVTRRDCNISPYYIERSGLIDDGYVHHGHYDNQIIKLQDGIFTDILLTQATWSYEHPYFVYSINNKIVDTLYGDDANEESCSAINEALYNTFYSKGISISVYDSQP